jgi:hypothetical protein
MNIAAAIFLVIELSCSIRQEALDFCERRETKFAGSAFSMLKRRSILVASRSTTTSGPARWSCGKNPRP